MILYIYIIVKLNLYSKLRRIKWHALYSETIQMYINIINGNSRNNNYQFNIHMERLYERKKEN